MYASDWWILAVALLSAGVCSLLGVFLLLRRMSMMGDALSHSVLPGIVVAYALLHSRGTWAMLVGAAVAGVVTVLLTQFLQRRGKVEESASMGVVFTTLFALGVVLFARLKHNVDLDLDCVLFGSLEAQSISSDMPRSLPLVGAVFALSVAVVVLLFKEFQIASFDPGLSSALGFPAGLFYYLLMVLVAMATVASFEAVGSVLVIAMLVVPAATARLLTDRLGTMLLLSVGLAMLAAGLGFLFTFVLPAALGVPSTPVAGMIALLCGLLFAAAFVFAPRHGVLGRWLHQRRLRRRLVREDVLGVLYRCEERGKPCALDDVARFVGVSPARARKVLGRHVKRGWAALSQPAGWRLTESGREEARAIIRAHRMWEVYLHQHLDVPLDHLHSSAEALEHLVDDGLRASLAAEVGEDLDPHGREIPS